jgi:hypothetical protein
MISLGFFVYFFASLVCNKKLFTTNNEIHTCSTTQLQNLRQPSVNLKKYQTGVYCMGIKIYNSLPLYIKNEFNNANKFESLLKNFLHGNSFYSLEEFYNYTRKSS